MENTSQSAKETQPKPLQTQEPQRQQQAPSQPEQQRDLQRVAKQGSENKMFSIAAVILIALAMLYMTFAKNRSLWPFDGLPASVSPTPTPTVKAQSRLTISVSDAAPLKAKIICSVETDSPVYQLVIYSGDEFNTIIYGNPNSASEVPVPPSVNIEYTYDKAGVYTVTCVPNLGDGELMTSDSPYAVQTDAHVGGAK
jgi:hypothetical protein